MLSEHTSDCPSCGQKGKRVWTGFKINQTAYFKSGFDPGLGKEFSTDRARNEYLAREKPNLRKLVHRPHGVVVGKA